MQSPIARPAKDRGALVLPAAPIFQIAQGAK